MEEQIKEYEVLKETIVQAISAVDQQKIEEIVEENPNANIAFVLNELDVHSQLTFLKLIKTEDASELFAYLDDEVQSELAQNFTEEWGMKLLQDLQSDELADVIEELPEETKSKILAYTPVNKRNELNKILSYDEDQVGSIMSIDISSLKYSYTCEQAMNKIKRDYHKNNAELVHYYYVVDETQKLLGVLTLEEIVFADPETKLVDIYSPIYSVNENDEKSYAAKIFSEHDMSVLPVVNADKKLVGMITSDDVIDVIHEENTEDLYNNVGINGEKATEYEYVKTPWYKLVQFRLLWLVLIFLLTTITQIILHVSLSAISKKIYTAANAGLITIALASMIPVINQTISTDTLQGNMSIKRALSLNEIDQKDYKKVILKEFIVGVVLGAIIGLLNVGRLSIYFLASKDLLGTNSHYYLAIIVGTSIAMFFAIICSQLLATIIPIISVKLKKDPSTVSVLIINLLSSFINCALMFVSTYLLIGAF